MDQHILWYLGHNSVEQQKENVNRLRASLPAKPLFIFPGINNKTCLEADKINGAIIDKHLLVAVLCVARWGKCQVFSGTADSLSFRLSPENGG